MEVAPRKHSVRGGYCSMGPASHQSPLVRAAHVNPTLIVQAYVYRPHTMRARVSTRVVSGNTRQPPTGSSSVWNSASARTALGGDVDRRVRRLLIGLWFVDAVLAQVEVAQPLRTAGRASQRLARAEAACSLDSMRPGAHQRGMRIALSTRARGARALLWWRVPVMGFWPHRSQRMPRCTGVVPARDVSSSMPSPPDFLFESSSCAACPAGLGPGVRLWPARQQAGRRRPCWLAPVGRPAEALQRRRDSQTHGGSRTRLGVIHVAL